MTEKLALKERFHHGGAITDHKLSAAAAPGVKRARNQLLTGSSFSGHQCRREMRRYPLDLSEQIEHRDSSSDDSFEGGRIEKVQFQLSRPLLLGLLLEPAIDACSQSLDRHRFIQVVIGTRLNRLHSRLGGVLPSHDKNVRLRGALAYFFEQFDAVYSGKDEIQENQARLEASDFG